MKNKIPLINLIVFILLVVFMILYFYLLFMYGGKQMSEVPLWVWWILHGN